MNPFAFIREERDEKLQQNRKQWQEVSLLDYLPWAMKFAWYGIFQVVASKGHWKRRAWGAR